MDNNFNHFSFLWNIAESLRGTYKEEDYRKVMLPMIIVRRFDCLLDNYARDPIKGKNYIVGWYKDATVTRYYYEDGDGWPKNVYADANNCVLLPINKRHKIVPRAGKEGYSYGMGQANVWFGKKDDEKANLYIKNILEYINSYDGENLALLNN